MENAYTFIVKFKHFMTDSYRLKVGIDSYCFHRLFGEVYPHQHRTAPTFSMEDFLSFCKGVDVDGVSLESCFFPEFSSAYLAQVKGWLDGYGFDRVYAWGHPDGLEGGNNQKEFESMIEHIQYASAIGAEVMRVVGSSLMFRFEPHQPQLEKLSKMFKVAVREAEANGIKLAIENHIDYNSDEILWLLEEVDSEYFGVNFDSGNFLRVLDDPVKAMEKLAPHVMATHIKDVLPVPGVSVDQWYFFSCVPTGKGLIDNQRIAQLLVDQKYQGFFAVETDTLHPDFAFQEQNVVAKSVQQLKNISNRCLYN
jgi:sugar phosphate isomerase/epimerase